MALSSGITTVLRLQFPWLAAAVAAVTACVPPGNAPPFDGGPQATLTAMPSATPRARPDKPPVASPPLTAVFEDNFDRPMAPAVPSPIPSAAAQGGQGVDAAVKGDAASKVDATAPDASSAVAVRSGSEGGIGPDWLLVGPNNTAWRIDQGKLCGRNAKNKGIWLNRTLPVNARIEFDATSDAVEGDIKAEVWGDGQSGATAVSYNNATSYLVIFGGWQNSIHALARLNEHGTDRKEIQVKPQSDEFRERAVAQGQTYRFKIERSDGKTVRWWVNDNEMLSFEDAKPLVGATHDHFGFNNWQVRVCYDNVKVTPLSPM